VESFNGKVAIVTGGASGIGQELCRELGARGSIVIVADINAEGARQVASTVCQRGGRAYAQNVDVSDEKAVGRLVGETAAEHQHLDYMFNNAGIAVGADARDLHLEHWRRVIDVNLWGVICGTTAAYAIMVGQGYGHIVNTASLLGLLPTPMNIPYSMTKHALVGLSLALRAEAADLGIKVSVVCPGIVQSGIYQATAVLNAPREKVMTRIPFRLMETAKAARTILHGVARNQAVIVFPGYARFLWWVYRLNASLLKPLGSKTVRDFRSVRTTNSAE
jgi:NAD(P)-dependent dehydrogenase (short-subunit alcohol dehydrogenase family)